MTLFAFIPFHPGLHTELEVAIGVIALVLILSLKFNNPRNP